VGDAVEKLEPLRKWLDSIARLLWNSQTEETKKLPPPEKRKQIEPPRPPSEHPFAQSNAGSAAREDMNDEVPF
jgi:hypothetical protein